MKCTNKRLLSLFVLCLIFITGCGNNKYDIPYSADTNISSFSIIEDSENSSKIDPFAKKLVVVEGNVDTSSIDIREATAAGMFDLTKGSAIYAKDIFEKMNPASLTKIMTAIVAMKNASPDLVLTASANVYVSDSSAQVVNIKEGDQMTLEQALNMMLVYSANDAANLIAEGVGGTIENFVIMMNAEANSLGATGTHFTNPNGLHDAEHYSTPYDMYLMMNTAIQYDLFNQIITKPEYQTVYYNAAGNEVSLEVESTNYYLIGKKTGPAGVTIIGGKTGSTSMAGHCLVLYSKDSKGAPYISVVMNSDNRDNLYAYTTELLEKIGK